MESYSFKIIGNRGVVAVVLIRQRPVAKPVSGLVVTDVCQVDPQRVVTQQPRSIPIALAHPGLGCGFRDPPCSAAAWNPYAFYRTEGANSFCTSGLSSTVCTMAGVSFIAGAACSKA